MRNKVRKSNALAVAAVLAAFAITPSASAQARGQKPVRVTIWSFTKEVELLLGDYKKSASIDDSKVQFDFIFSNMASYQSKLDAALSSEKDGPDVFALDSAWLGKYVESGRLGDLSSLAPDNSGSFPYLVGMGTDRGGTLRALSWLATPGGFLYRRSLAKKYLGTDDPAGVQSRISDPTAFLETARELKRSSKGKVAIVCSTEELFRPFVSARVSGWLDGDDLVIEPLALELARLTEIFRDEALDPRIPMWSDEWFLRMGGTASDASADDAEIFGYFLPTWGLQYVLKPNARNKLGSDTRGDWGLAQGPVAYSWGGTWLAASGREGKVAEESLKFIKFCCTDAAYQSELTRRSELPVARIAASEDAKSRYADPFLGGQNYYAAFVEIARSVKGGNLSPKDGEIEAIWLDLMKAFRRGKQNHNAFIEEFRLEFEKTFRTAPRGIDVR